MKKYSCYGYPITHPTTRRLEGVIDVTFLSEDDSPLLRPMLTRAVEDVHRRLLEGARSTETALLAAFQEAVSRRRGAPVIAIGEDVFFFANTAAQQVLESVDHTVLRAVTEGTPSGRQLTKDLTLNSGLAVRTIWRRVTSRGGVVLEFDPVATPRHRHSVVDRREVRTAPTRTVAGRLAAAREHRFTTLITGDQGTGKSRALTNLAADTPVSWHRATVLTDAPAAHWLEDLRQSLDTHTGWSPWRTSTSYLPRWHAGRRPSRRQQRMVGTDERDPRCRRDRTPADRSTLPHTDHPRFPALTCRRNPPACAGDPSGDRRRGQRSTHHRRRRCAHPPPVARQYCRAEDDPRGRRTAALLGRHHRGSATDAVPWAPARDEPVAAGGTRSHRARTRPQWRQQASRCEEPRYQSYHPVQADEPAGHSRLNSTSGGRKVSRTRTLFRRDWGHYGFTIDPV